jgi:hypothetical protein
MATMAAVLDASLLYIVYHQYSAPWDIPFLEYVAARRDSAGRCGAFAAKRRFFPTWR